MKNPFDEKKDKEKHEFFKQITSAIDEKINQLNIKQNHIDVYFEERKKELESIKDRHLDFIISQVNYFLKKNYPEISQSLSLYENDLKNNVGKQNENSLKIEKNLEIILKSDSLYEDVYKLRDELKEIKGFMNALKNKVKRDFEV